MNKTVAFFYGDSALAKKDIFSLKKKYSNLEVLEFSLSDDSFDEIMTACASSCFASEQKIVILSDIPNKKDAREFILRLSNLLGEEVKLIIWDSENIIRVDPKTKSINDTWNNFLLELKNISGVKVVDFGSEFTEKEEGDVVKYISLLFSKKGKTIDQEAAKLIFSMVGGVRSNLATEVEKLSLLDYQNINREIVLEYCYAINQEAILWKFSSILDKCSILDAMAAIREYLNNDVNENVLAEIMMKRARWQLTAAYFWSQGMQWYDVDAELLRFGKFPSIVWRDESKSQSEKKSLEAKYKEIENTTSLFEGIGFDKSVFKKLKMSGAKLKSSDVLPMPFLANQITSFLNSKIVGQNSQKYTQKEIRSKLALKCLSTYLTVSDKMKEMRFNNTPESSLYEMARALSDYRI